MPTTGLLEILKTPEGHQREFLGGTCSVLAEIAAATALSFRESRLSLVEACDRLS